MTVAAENLEAAVCAYLSVFPAWIRQALDSGEWRRLDLREREAAAVEKGLIEKDAELAALVRIAAKGGAQAQHAEQQADRLSPEIEQLRHDYQRLSRDAPTLRADLEQLDILRFGGSPEDELDSRILWWWQHAEQGVKPETFASLFDNDHSRPGCPQSDLPLRVPAAPVHRPQAARELDYAASPWLRRGEGA